MRYIALLLLSKLSFFTLSAQTVSGIAKEAAGQPLTGATVTLYKDSAIAKLAVTKENGSYRFEAVKPGTYRVGTSFVGSAPAISKPFAVANADVNVPDLLITKASAALQNVTVTAKKPLVEIKADKMIV